MSTKLPKLFIGSSVEGLPVAYAIQSNLNHSADVVVWDQGVFTLSDTTIESLVAILNTCDFGIFIFSPDDIGLIKGSRDKIIRDNVLFELGLFIGSIGRNRTFIVAPKNSPKMRIPTDLLGITLGRYDTEKLDDNPQASTAAFCNDVRIAIKKKGFLRQTESIDTAISDNQEIVEPKSSSQDEVNNNDWIELYYANKFDDSIEAINKKLEGELDDADRVFLNTMIAVCKAKSNPSEGVKGVEAYLKDNQDSVHAWQAVAFFYLQGILFQKAEKIIDEGLTKFPDNFGLLKYKADLLSRKGRPSEAVDLLEPFIASDETVLSKYIDYCKEAGMQPEALQAIRLAFLENAYSEYIISTYARLAYDEEKHKVALYLYNYLVGLYPDKAYYKVMLGNSAILFDFHDIALINYRAAAEIYKESDNFAIENIGHILQILGLHEEAKAYFLKAVETDKNSAYSYNRLSDLISIQKKEAERFEKTRIEGRIEAFFKPDESSAKLLD